MIKDIIEQRVKERVPFMLLEKLNLSEVYIAGNSLNRANPNDVDLYPVMTSFDRIPLELYTKNGCRILSKTRNALTVLYESKVIQFINYHHPTLYQLVDSFDYAHIQIGALYRNHEIAEVYYTSAWEEAHLSENTWYTHSEYPLSSLIRSFKYKERGTFSGNSHIFSVINILADIVERGFTSYNDFKDQLDAVDLGLVPEDFQGCQNVLFHLYTVLTKENKQC